MKVILRSDVAKIGQKNEVKEVKNGFATNFLFPQGLAEPATPRKIAELEKKQQENIAQNEIKLALWKKNLETLGGKKVSMRVKANEKGHLYQSIHNEEIAQALREQERIEINPENITLEHPIKEIGEHTVSIRGEGGEGSFLLSIESTEKEGKSD